MYSPGTIPRMLTISWRIGLAIFLPFTTTLSFMAPRSSRSSTRKPASRWWYQAMLAERILDIEINVVGVIVRPAHRDDELGLALDLALLGLRIHHQEGEEEQKRALTCSALNSITLKGSKGLSRG